MTDNNTFVPAAPSPRPSNFDADGEFDPSSRNATSPQHESKSQRKSKLPATTELETATTENSISGKPVRCAKFRQQELWAWKPVWSPRVIIIMYLVVSAIFIPLGIVLLTQSLNLFSTSLLRYDANSCAVANQTTVDTPASTCTIRLNVGKDIVAAPSYFYYGITNFYQNARTYVKSRSDEQLRGNENPDTTVCVPLEFDPADNTTVLNPCGLVANSKFNDTFRLCRDVNCNDEVNLNGTNIAWDIDRESRFTKGTSEDFMVWMRLSAYRTWKKLYRRIEEDLTKGDYWVKINSRYPVSGFGGKKFFFISQTTWFGGPNLPLAISYIVVGCISLSIAVFFGVRSKLTKEMELPPETSVYLEGLVKHPVEQQLKVKMGPNVSNSVV